MFPSDVLTASARVLELAKAKKVMIAAAESCTAGLLTGALTSHSGSAEVVDRGFVTYCNEAKTEMLGVEKALLDDVGAVSEPVAKAMAQGALQRSRAQLTVSITGIAGPTGGTPMKPVGLVHFASAMVGRSVHHRVENFGALGRDRVREAAVKVALKMLLERLEGVQTPADAAGGGFGLERKGV